MLDLQLQLAAAQVVDLLGERIQLHPDAAGGLVDEVDGRVGEAPIRDVAVGHGGGRDDGQVGDAHAVVHLVLILDAAQDGDGLLYAGLVDEDGLEASLQRRVLLDGAVLLEGRGAYHAQLSASQGGLKHVAGVHRALGLAGADDRVQFVDEEDDIAGRARGLLDDGLEAFLELTTVLGPGEEAAHVELHDALVLQALGHVLVDYALREALGDGSLSHSGFADQDRVVLGAAQEDLHGAADLVVAADDGVQLAVASALGEVDAVGLQRLEGALGAAAVNVLATSDGLGRLLEGGGRWQSAEFLAGSLAQGHEQRVDRNEGVLPLFCQGLGAGENVA